MTNPWNISSIYELQYFNCPSCIFKNRSKQEIVSHAYECHPESVNFLSKICDNSLSDIICPWNDYIIKEEILEDFSNSFKDIHKDDSCAREILSEIKIEETNLVEATNCNEIVHEGLKKYNCNKCGKYFGRAGDLKRHNKTIHEGLKNFKCHKCDKSFGQSYHLKRHQTVHEGK